MTQTGSRFGTVLVVDDDERVLASFQRYVARGRTIFTASNVETARGLARAHPPDLAVVDLHIGRDSGIDLIRKLKAELPGAVVVLLSGYASVEATVQAMKAGADDVLVKPVTLAEITRRLSEDECAAVEPETASLARVQWEHVHRVLADCDGNITLAARRLSTSRSTLQRWVRRNAPLPGDVGED